MGRCCGSSASACTWGFWTARRPGTPERFRQDWLGVHTPVKNVKLAGADVYLHGLLGAAMGGVAAAGAALGPLGFPRAMTAIMARRGR